MRPKYFRDPQFFKTLYQLLDEECTAHKAYIATLQREKDAVIQFRPEEVESYTQQREGLCNLIDQLQRRRRDFMMRFPDADRMKLSDFLVKFCHPDDAKRVLPMVRLLKDLIATSRTLGKEFNQIVDFSLTVVNGSMSIMRSARCCVNRGYGRKGQVRESYHRVASEITTRV